VERLAALGVNIFIPKPLRTTLEDAERIVQAQKQYGVKIAVGPSARFSATDDGCEAGGRSGLDWQAVAVRICHHHGTIDVFNQHDWYREPSEGGPELSLGWYGIDLGLAPDGKTR